MPPGVSCPAWYRLVFVDTMANRDHSKSRSPVNAFRRDAGRLSQASTVAAPSQLDALMLAPTPARGDFHTEWLPDSQQPSGTSSQVFAIPVSLSPFAHHVSWGSANAGSCAGFGAFPDSSSCEHGPPFRVHALPPSSRAWLLQLCLTRDRHHLCLPSLRSVAVTIGAANAHAKASPPFLV